MSGLRTGAVWRRRALLAGGAIAVVAWVEGAPRLLTRRDRLEFEALPGLLPFRELVTGGSVSVASQVFAGLTTATPSEDHARTIEEVRADPCTALYGPRRDGPMPVAFFSDFRCPNCRVMDRRLGELDADAPGRFRIVHHELPILGAASVTASRAVLAADRQGAYDAMHARLSRTAAVTAPAFVARIAADLGLDVPRFLADLTSSAIGRDLDRSRAIADVFGFYGTPAFAAGRTVFLGAVPKSLFAALLTEEDGTSCRDARPLPGGEGDVVGR